MDRDALTSNRPSLRFNLRTAAAIAVFLTIGLTASISIHSGDASGWSIADRIDFISLFATAAMSAIVAGLLQEVRWIHRAAASQSLSRELRFPVRWEQTWRAGAAAILILCILVQILRARTSFKLPDTDFQFSYFGEIFPSYLGWLCLVAVLCEEARRESLTREHPRRRWFDLIVWACLGLFLLRMLSQCSIITFLVHVACNGVDASLLRAPHRYQLTTPVQQRDFFLAALFATAAALTATAGAIRFFAHPPATRRRRILLASGGVLSLTVAAAYCVWYYAKGLAMASPDLAETVFAMNWYETLGGAALGSLLITMGTHRITRQDFNSEAGSFRVTMPASWRSALPTMGLLLIAGAIAVKQFVEIFFNPHYGSFIDQLDYLLTYPQVYLALATFLFCIQITRRRWRDRGKSPSLNIAPLSARRFATAWLTLAAVTAVLMPTLAALAFAMWLGPWYRW